MTQPTHMYPPPPLMPQPVPRHRMKRRLWPWLTAVAAVLFVGGAFVFAFWVTSDDTTPSNSNTRLRQAFTACETGNLADGDHTLVIDTAGEDYDSGTDDIADLACILGELGTPTSVTAKMDATRALDGMQSAQWHDFEASWTYHPANGLDLVITEHD